MHTQATYTSNPKRILPTRNTLPAVAQQAHQLLTSTRMQQAAAATAAEDVSPAACLPVRSSMHARARPSALARPGRTACTVRRAAPRRFDHVMCKVVDYEASKSFYQKALKPLGMGVVKDMPEHKSCGFGAAFPGFWIAEGDIRACTQARSKHACLGFGAMHAWNARMAMHAWHRTLGIARMSQVLARFGAPP